eukprot:TRINITY_DN5716_c0_g1_i1.p2 TRINITY_DN5716_c0_g1~~TRINITY_DN5716_c0_g1_i1.p2  ORF type:complete len:388 (+),score=33.72 TRINITY_DN5716_c0_g1_i1:23-1165(+)
MDGFPTAPLFLANAQQNSIVIGLGEVMNGNHALGLVFVFLVALIWQLASYIVQSIESQGLSPFILTYLANSLFIILLPIAKLKYVWRYACNYKRQAPQPVDEVVLIESAVSNQSGTGDKEFDEWQTIKSALVVSPLWFLGQYTNNLALNSTSVSSNTILSTPASLFTYVLAVFMVPGETFQMRKLLSIIVCMFGVIMVTVVDMEMSRDQDGTHGGVWGDLLTILSALLYACYTISLRLMLKEDQESDMASFFGYVGLINAVALLPILMVCVAVGTINLAEISRAALAWAALKGLFDNVLSDYLWARAVLLIGPTIATVGLSIQVPISLVVDPIVKEPVWATEVGSTVVTIFGAGLVLLGFYSINMERPFPCCDGNENRAE